MKSDFRKFTTHETPCRNFERTTHNNEMHRLTSEDYAVDAVTAAKALVGAWLCRRMEDGSVVRWQKGTFLYKFYCICLAVGDGMW